MNGKKYRVLVVEDDSISQRFLETILFALDCDVESATGEEEALKLLVEPFDLILMDLGLEDTDGFTLTNKIKRLGGIFHDVPVIGITANLTDLYRTKAKECHMQEILEKPVRSTDIKRIIQMYVN